MATPSGDFKCAWGRIRSPVLINSIAKGSRINKNSRPPLRPVAGGKLRQAYGSNCPKQYNTKAPMLPHEDSVLYVLGGGFEPPTPGSSDQCSNQLSYPSMSFSILFM